VSATIEAIEDPEALRSTAAIATAAAAIVVTEDVRSIADAPTAAVVRDVIAIGRERTERSLPPKRWMG
jgi:hypothetical protein